MTNVIGSLNMSLGEGTKNRGPFSRAESMFKLALPGLDEYFEEMDDADKSGKAALNQFGIMFEERLPKP